MLGPIKLPIWRSNLSIICGKKKKFMYQDEKNDIV